VEFSSDLVARLYKPTSMVAEDEAPMWKSLAPLGTYRTDVCCCGLSATFPLPLPPSHGQTIEELL